jgi:hypothetical protein
MNPYFGRPIASLIAPIVNGSGPGAIDFEEKRGRLAVAMNTARSEMPVMYSLDGDPWKDTPYQTAYFRYALNQAVVKTIWDWLGDH